MPVVSAHFRSLCPPSLITGQVSEGGLRGPRPQASHQTVHILFLANIQLYSTECTLAENIDINNNDRCLRDYDLVVAHC